MTNPTNTADLRAAAQAVVDRWDTPTWKDVPATAEYINRLRAALAAPKQPAAPIDAAMQQDAERWQFFADYMVSTRTDLDDAIVGCDSVQKMAKVLDAARATQKEAND